MALAFVALVAGTVFFCWLLFTLAIYALPFFVGLTVAFAAYDSGAGFGAPIVGLLAGLATLAAGRIIFARSHSALVRVGIGLLYAVPATIAGYHAALGLAQIGVPSPAWQIVFAIIGAASTGTTAWTRMWLLTPDGDAAGFGGFAGYLPFRRQ